MINFRAAKLILISTVLAAANTFVFPQTKPKSAPVSIANQNQLKEILNLVEAKQFAAAESKLKEILKKTPRDFNALTLLGIVYGETQRFDEAETRFRHALQINPQFQTAQENLAMIYAGRGESKKALPLLEKLSGITTAVKTPQTKDLSILFALLKIYGLEKNAGGAGKTADYIETIGGSDARVLFTLGLTLAQSGDYVRAAKLFERVNEIRPNTVEVLYNLGVAYYNTDQLDAARATLLKVAAINPNAPEVYYRLGLIASAKNEPESALDFWLKALELKPVYAEVNFLIGEELRKQKKYYAALPFYEKAAAQDLKNPLYRARLGVDYFLLKRYPQAAQIFDELLVKYPNDFNFNYLAGFVARNQGFYDKAQASFEKADKISPDNADVLSGLGFIAFQRGEIEKAELLLRRALKLDPKNFPVHYDLGRLLLRKNKFDEALPILENGVQLNEIDPSIRYQLFLAYSRLQQKDKAAATFAEFKRLEKESSAPSGSAANADINRNLPAKIENQKP